VDDFREHINNISGDKDIVVYCKAGYRGYLAQRILKQKGFNVKNLDGGYFMVR
jgi:rhodanese-related sulfurtransferase